MKILLVIAVVLVVYLTGRIGFGLAVLAGLGFVVAAVLVLILITRLSGKKETGADAAVPEETKSPGASIESSEPVELAPAIEALQSGNFQKAIDLAEPYVRDVRDEIRIDAMRLTGFGHAGLGQHAQAYPCWVAVTEAEPSSQNYLNVASTAAVIEHFDEAEAAYLTCQRIYTQERGADPVEGLIFNGQYQANFLSSLDKAGRSDLAFKYLEPLAGFYRSLHITDSTFLHLRQMPFFEVFLEQSLPLVRRVLDEDALTAWYRTTYDAVDEPGQAMFARYHVPH
ncbi:hypothetical protein EC912_101656 [Luteibacter rhizovicinus]|uniref:Uncharacterized protein n=1 Tax=Luteibacter rhizovicinus TaxID=242606 RepID=A0A4V2W4Y1_9GAMM|nr:hypothetical protein [Luteibacter rhizovicinus]TCV97639.1 hypothetical protein EC912_101656 [Luteibacter rhizovicinus]